MSINKITFAGHSAILLETESKVIAIDPWLDGNPSCPEELINPEKIDLIVLTHGHADHASDTPRLAKKYNSKVAATYELANLIIAEGVDSENMFFMNTGGTIDFEGIKITLVPALHSSSFDAQDGTKYAGQPCGVIINDGANSFYHAGDTALFSDMKLIAEQYNPKISFLPIGDVFTMGPKDAATAANWLKSEIVIPIHYNTFDMLTGTAEEFSTNCTESKCVVLNPGEIYNI